MHDDKLPDWVDRQVVERRLGIKVMPNDVESITITRAEEVKEPMNPKLGKNDTIEPPAGVQPSKFLHYLANPNISTVAVNQVLNNPVRRRSLTLNLKPVSNSFVLAQQVTTVLPDDPVKVVALMLGFVVLLAIVANIVRYFQEHLSDKAAILAVNDLRRKTYDHALHIPLSFFGTAGTSDVTSRLVQDAAGLQDGFKIILGQTIQEPIRAAMAFGMALWIDWRLTAFIVLFAPAMVAIIRKFGKKVRRATRAALQNSASMLGQIEGTLAGIRVVKAATSERFERRRYNGIMTELVEQQLKMSRYEALSTPTMETLTLIVVSCVVLFAVYLVCKRHSLDVTMFFLLMGALIQIGESLRKVSKLNAVLNRSNAAAARL